MTIATISSGKLDPVGWILLVTAKAFALLGGAALTAIVGISLVSIVGRKIASSPVTGDVEILQFCAAPAIACFFAYCHLRDGDVRVDIISDRLSEKWRRALAALGSMLLGLVAALIAWRTGAGAISLFEAGETTALLSLPVWFSQTLVVPGFVLQAIAGFYMAYRHISGLGAFPS
jgi:TRAP-type C4-dicarboxylate transport system permease small subunit